MMATSLVLALTVFFSSVVGLVSVGFASALLVSAARTEHRPSVTPSAQRINRFFIGRKIFHDPRPKSRAEFAKNHVTILPPRRLTLRNNKGWSHEPPKTNKRNYEDKQ